MTYLHILYQGITLAAVFGFLDYVFDKKPEDLSSKPARTRWVAAHFLVGMLALAVIGQFATITGILLSFLVDTVKYAVRLRQFGWR